MLSVRCNKVMLSFGPSASLSALKHASAYALACLLINHFIRFPKKKNKKKKKVVPVLLRYFLPPHTP